jgi:hypothetical protein
MKRIISLFTLVLLFSISSVYAQCCKNAAQASNCAASSKCASATAMAQNTDAGAVQVIYFHATRRCATCMAVEDVSKEVLKDNFGGKISFNSINREEDSKNPLIEKYKVAGQTLLIIKGDKVVDLTNDAFLNARVNPDKFKAKLKTTIESMK